MVCCSIFTTLKKGTKISSAPALAIWVMRVCLCARDGCVLQGSDGDYRLFTVAQTLNFSLLMRSSRVYEEPFFYSAIAWKCNCNKNVRALTLFLAIRHVCDTNT